VCSDKYLTKVEHLLERHKLFAFICLFDKNMSCVFMLVQYREFLSLVMTPILIVP
jgi:hypothetical protein